jgi:hypothetical protein
MDTLLLWELGVASAFGITWKLLISFSIDKEAGSDRLAYFERKFQRIRFFKSSWRSRLPIQMEARNG